jgi:hypothetical protein
MEPLEFEGRRSRKSRDRHVVPGSAGHESSLLTGPGVQPGGRHPGRGTGPHAPARQRYPGGTAPQWPPARQAAANRSVEPYSDGGSGYGYGENDRGYSRRYGNDGSDGNGYGYGDADPAWDEPTAGGYPPRQGTIQGTVEPRNGNSVSMAARILSVADYEAASITQQASLQAAMVTRRVAYEATGIREAAKREADDIVQRASLQAAAVREAAEIEADEVRMAVTSMQTELSELAERIRNTLPHPVLPIEAPPAERPATGPAARPPTRPQARRRTGPQDRLAEKPGARPRTGPQEKVAGALGARPTGKSGKPGTQAAGRTTSGQGRQAAAMRFAVIATSALFMVAVVAGAVEIHLHGFSFFIFRSVGTGETGRGPGGLQESQGPGQPDAPKPTPGQVNVQPSPHSSVTVHSGN